MVIHVQRGGEERERERERETERERERDGKEGGSKGGLADWREKTQISKRTPLLSCTPLASME